MPTADTPAERLPGARTRDEMRRGLGIAVAMGVMNVATYGYTIVAARLLGPASYGAFAAFMGLLLVVGVFQLGLQATGARRIASDPTQAGAVEHALVSVTYAASVSLAAICLVLTPLINGVLHLGSVLTASLVAVAALEMTLLGGQAGILQGERRWRPLAWLYVATGVARFGVGTAMLLLEPTEPVAISGVVIAFIAPCLLGWVTLRRTVARRVGVSDHTRRAILMETLRNSHALFAFLALSNADVIIARNVLAAHDAGLYAGGVILAKAVLFLPQFVVILAFPSMSTDSERRRALIGGTSFVLAISLIATALTWALSSLAVTFIGGQAYGEIQSLLWRFAMLGGVLSTLQLIVYSVVARQSRWSVYLIWAALAAALACAQLVSTVNDMVNLVLSINVVLLLVLLVLSVVRTGPRARPR